MSLRGPISHALGHWRSAFLPVLMALGVLAAQFVGVAVCPDAAMGCGTPAAKQVAAADASCCGSDECCCKPESNSDTSKSDLASAALTDPDQAADVDDCCRQPQADAASTGNCQRCGCTIQRGPPTPVQPREVRTVSFKSIPAILVRIPMRLPELVAQPQNVQFRTPALVDRGKQRALLSVWLI